MPKVSNFSFNACTQYFLRFLADVHNQNIPSTGFDNAFREGIIHINWSLSYELKYETCQGLSSQHSVLVIFLKRSYYITLYEVYKNPY